eukprot:Skav225391  [mRNA]  locus=scaffold2656:223924:231225:+ [translate_table: standard]
MEGFARHITDTRDWCSAVNGARSIGVSSTGLSRSNSFAVGPSASVVSSASGSCSYHDGGVGEYHAKNYLKDLKAFSKSFTEPFTIAKECITQVDADLSTTLMLTESQANDLIVSAQNVTWKLSSMACKNLAGHGSCKWRAF